MTLLCSRLEFGSVLDSRSFPLFAILLCAGITPAQGPRWSTLMGGNQRDLAYGVAVDTNGLVTIAGRTESTNWPYGPPSRANADVFVARLDPRASGPAQLKWCTTLPGDGVDMAFDLAMSPDGGEIYVVGVTTSAALFPVTTNAYQRTLRGPADAFVLQLDGAGTINYLSYLGGDGFDWANAVERDASGSLVLAGVTDAQSFPWTQGAYDTTFNGNTDMFVSLFDPRLSGAAQNVASTFLGGSSFEGVPFNLATTGNMTIGDLAIAGDGTIAFVGRTASCNFPTTPTAFQTACAGGVNADMFVTRLDAALASLRYSSYLGGTNDDGATNVVLNAVGDLCIAGFTWSPGNSFPTTAGAVQRTLAGQNDAVLAVLRTDGPGAGLRYATLLGGSDVEIFAALVVEDSGVMTAVGLSGSSNLVGTSGSWQPASSPRDIMIARIDPAGSGGADLHYLSFFGGPGGSDENAWAIVSHGDGLITFAGSSDAALLTTPLALQRVPGGLHDAYVCTFDPLAMGTRRHGTSTPGCRGPVWLQVNSNPAPSHSTFQVLGNGAPLSAPGAHVFGITPLPGVSILNAALYVTPDIPLPAISWADGSWRMSLPLPAGWAPPVLFLQSFWINPASCANGPLSASHALGF